MIRTIIWFIYFWLYLIALLPRMAKAKRLEKAGNLAERDKLVDREVRNWARSLIRLGGGKIEVVGAENIPAGQPVVFISNHQGNYDIPIMLGHVPTPKAFISKIEVLKLPLIRTWMKFMQCAFMDRKDIRQSLRTINEAAQSIRSGYSMVIFPEGTRGKGKPMAEFKAGSFKLAQKAGVPIIPVTIDGSWRLMEEHGYMKPANVKVTIHPSVPTAGISREDMEALPDKVKAIIQSVLPQ